LTFIEIYDFGFWIYDFFDPKNGRFVDFPDRNNRKSKIQNRKSRI